MHLPISFSYLIYLQHYLSHNVNTQVLLPFLYHCHVRNIHQTVLLLTFGYRVLNILNF